MASAQIPMIYDELLDHLIRNASPDEILAFAPSPKAQARAEYLLAQNSAGTLTPDEHHELDQLLYFDRKISVLKARAAAQLKQP